MAIEIEIEESKTDVVKPFPKLMTLNKGGGVFFFSEESKCFCINPPNPNNEGWISGEFSDTFLAIFCIDYNQPITIKNK